MITLTGLRTTEDDLRAVLPLDVDLVNLPKIESAEQLKQAVAEIEAIEARLGVRGGAGLLINIETPRALRNALSIGEGHWGVFVQRPGSLFLLVVVVVVLVLPRAMAALKRRRAAG